MPDAKQIVGVLQHLEGYLTEYLLPFWIERSPDTEAGGFLTYLNRDGQPTGETTKTLLMQLRMLYTMASAHRAGYGGGRCAELAQMGAEFILSHFWDHANEGWYWIADRFGNPLHRGKIGYGQCFGIYAFSEYHMATGDSRGREAAERTYAAVCKHMVDTRHGGYLEIMQPNWQPEKTGKYGGDRKSLDVHMHMLEALTNLYQMTGQATHRRRLLEVIDLIVVRMLRPVSGTGYMQFSLDFEPLPAILFEVEWGRDAKPEDGLARPLSTTSYGHNVEFAWLLLHAADVLGQPRATYTEVVRKIFDHTIRYGIDYTYGGIYVEGPDDAPTAITEKQFWQQAEVLIGMLDAYAMFGDHRFWDGFEKVYRFVFDKFVNLKAGGEWYERLDREGNILDGALGHAWKISYHTVRSIIQTVKRLKLLLAHSA